MNVRAACLRPLLRAAARHRPVLQLLALLLGATGYCLLLATSVLAPDSSPSVALNNASARALPQAVLMRPATAVTTSGSDVNAVDGDPDSGTEVVDLEALESELEKRRQVVWKVCQDSGLSKSNHINAWEFFIDYGHGLVWCNIFKAASTAWLYNFNLLAGFKESYLRRSLKNPLILARTHYPRPSPRELEEALPESLSFLIVREPFERLLSAYRNKLEGLRHRFYRKLGRDIAARYKRPVVVTPNGRDITVPIVGPSFSQFVDYVIDTGLHAQPPRFDEHWAPYYRFCTPCKANFTVIAKVETLSRDEEYIIHRAGLDTTLLAASRRRDRPRRVINKARDGRATADLVNKYYSQLSRNQMEQLFMIYKTDFDMFGYNSSKYFSLDLRDS